MRTISETAPFTRRLPPQAARESERNLLERLLALRFGTLPATVSIRLAQAESCQLEIWAQRMLQADSLEQVFTDA